LKSDNDSVVILEQELTYNLKLDFPRLGSTFFSKPLFPFSSYTDEYGDRQSVRNPIDLFRHALPHSYSTRSSSCLAPTTRARIRRWSCELCVACPGLIRW